MTLRPCLSNALNALTLRHLALPTNPISRFSCKILSMEFEALRDSFWQHWSSENEQWRIKRGVAKLKGIDDSLAEDRVEFDQVKMMIKKEGTTILFDGSGNPKKARAIQFTVNERSAYEFAAESHAFSSALCTISSKYLSYKGVRFCVTYCAHMNHDQISDFATESERLRTSFRWSVIDERDGKNWDANIQVAHRKSLVGLYHRIDPAFGSYAAAGICVRGRFSSKYGGRLNYWVYGTVKSGHFDTSSGNGAINREVAIQAITDLPNDLRPTLVRALVMGDDYIAWLYYDKAVCPRQLHAALNVCEARYGIHPERGLFSDLRCASFISLGFYRCHDGSFAALPKIGRQLCRLMWTVTDLQGRDPRRLASSVAGAFYPLFSTFPLMRRFLKYHMQVPPLDFPDYEAASGAKGYKWWEYVARLRSPIDWRDNHLAKYGPTGLLLDEVAIPDGNQWAALIHSPIVDHCYSVDVADPADRFGCISTMTR